MKGLRRFILFLIVLIALGAIGVATCPASFAWRFAASRAGALTLDGLSGTVWNGHAASASVFGTALGALDWQLHPLPLLQGVVAAQLDLHGGEVTGSGAVAREADGSLNVGVATIHLPASLAAPVLDIPLLQLLGQIDINIAQMRVQGAWPTAAQGTILWRNAAVAGAAQASLGDLQAQFASAPGGSIAGTAHDRGGPLQLDGTFRIDAGGYDVRAKLAARDANPQVLGALRYIGQPQGDGTTLLLIHGKFLAVF
ncbi:MAG: type II secretion system protein N [Xanthomonadaceae bacterium]|nr:type II secretion system protein N [Xanthomonadaceae bacterium]